MTSNDLQADEDISDRGHLPTMVNGCYSETTTTCENDASVDVHCWTNDDVDTTAAANKSGNFSNLSHTGSNDDTDANASPHEDIDAAEDGQKAASDDMLNDKTTTNNNVNDGDDTVVNVDRTRRMVKENLVEGLESSKAIVDLLFKSFMAYTEEAADTQRIMNTVRKSEHEEGNRLDQVTPQVEQLHAFTVPMQQQQPFSESKTNSLDHASKQHEFHQDTQQTQK